MRYFGNGVAVVLRVAAHDDLGAFRADGRVGGIFQMLIGNAAVFVENFVVPFSFEVHLGLNEVVETVPT